MTALLCLTDVSLAHAGPHGSVIVVDRVSFDIAASDRLVLLGPSGCGKSTLLKAVGGHLRQSSGTIAIRGQPVDGPGPDRMMVFQEFDQLLAWKTVVQNVAFPLLIARKLTPQAARERALKFIEKVGLERASDAYPHTLSSGMKQRVAIARCLAMEPEIMMMDEPFASLDALTRHAAQDELLRLWRDVGFTLLFVTHSIAEAIRIGTRILLMSGRPARIVGDIVDVQEIASNDHGRLRLERHIRDTLFPALSSTASAL